jgi:hypothetical protein
MRIFLSYSSSDRPRAEEISLALEGEGHDVFFDREELSGGEDFHAVIRREVAAADLFVFLISPASVAGGAYTLTELRLAREKWPHPRDCVLPVLLEATELGSIPAYLRGVTIFEPEGNVAGEVAAHIGKARNLRPRLAVAGGLLLVIAALASIPALRGLLTGNPDEPHFVSTIAAGDFVAGFVFEPEYLERIEYALDPTSEFPADGADFLRLERIAFGGIAATSPGFNIRLRLHNTMDRPIQLDITPRFFELADDQGRAAELVYFCCDASGDMLSPGQEREIQLIYRSPPGWEGKETAAGMIYFRVSGLLPVVRASWAFPPLATAD